MDVVHVAVVLHGGVAAFGAVGMVVGGMDLVVAHSPYSFGMSSSAVQQGAADELDDVTVGE